MTKIFFNICYLNQVNKITKLKFHGKASLVLLIVGSIKLCYMFDINSWYLIHCDNKTAYAAGPITYYAINQTRKNNDTTEKSILKRQNLKITKRIINAPST